MISQSTSIVIQRLLLCILPVLLFGCNPSSNSNVHLVVSGDTAGWITPCGCAINQSGGLERRASLLKSLGASERVIYLDVGGSAAGSSLYQQAKLEAILHGDKSMGLEVHNVGAPETLLSPEVLMNLGTSAGVQWISCNLDAVSTTGSSAAEGIATHRLIERRGLKVLVVGVIDGALVKNPQWKTRDPATSVLSVLARQTADIKVVLAYMDEPKLRALAESIPEVDFIIGGPTGQSMPPTQVGPVSVMSATNKGKFLASIELTNNGKRWQRKNMESAEVKSALPRDSTQSNNMESFLKLLGERDFPAAETGLVSTMTMSANDQGRFEIAGSESCKKCHQADDQIWQASKHSHAWKTLESKKSHVDPSCQVCHTTGYGLLGGFQRVSDSQSVVNVGCESCHGPSKSHVLDPKTKTPYLAKEQCVRCHDHENSPEFAYASYWAKIAHGKPDANK